MTDKNEALSVHAAAEEPLIILATEVPQKGERPYFKERLPTGLEVLNAQVEAAPEPAGDDLPGAVMESEYTPPRKKWSSYVRFAPHIKKMQSYPGIYVCTLIREASWGFDENFATDATG